MTYEEIKSMIDETGLPSNYYQYPEGEAPAPPYILFYYPERNDFAADNTNYVKIAALNIEFYSAEKDFENEAVIETVLERHGLFYDKEEQYIESEHMYEVLYTTEVTING